MTPVQLAKIVHANVKTHGDATGCFLIPEWAGSTPEYKTMILASIERFVICPIDMTPEINHAMYILDAVQRGWRTGQAFDADTKINPRIRPFSDLCREQKYINDIILSTYRHYNKILIPDYDYSRCAADAHRPTNVVNTYVHEQHIYQGNR